MQRNKYTTYEDVHALCSLWYSPSMIGLIASIGTARGAGDYLCRCGASARPLPPPFLLVVALALALAARRGRRAAVLWGWRRSAGRTGPSVWWHGVLGRTARSGGKHAIGAAAEPRREPDGGGRGGESELRRGVPLAPRLVLGRGRAKATPLRGDAIHEARVPLDSRHAPRQLEPSAKCLRRGGIRRGGRRRSCHKRRVGRSGGCRSGGWLTRRDAEGVRFGGAPVLLFLLAPAGGGAFWLQLRALWTARAVPPGLAPPLPRDVLLAGGPTEVTAPACAPVARCGPRSRQRARRWRRPCGLRHVPLAPTGALLAALLLGVSALLPRLDTLEVSAHIPCRVRGGSASHHPSTHASATFFLPRRPSFWSGDLLSAAVPRRRVRFRPSSQRDLWNRLDLFLWRLGISARHFPSALVQRERLRPVATLCCDLRSWAGGFSRGDSHRGNLITQRADAQRCADGGDSQRADDSHTHNPHILHFG